MNVSSQFELLKVSRGSRRGPYGFPQLVTATPPEMRPQSWSVSVVAKNVGTKTGMIDNGWNSENLLVQGYKLRFRAMRTIYLKAPSYLTLASLCLSLNSSRLVGENFGPLVKKNLWALLVLCDKVTPFLYVLQCDGQNNFLLLVSVDLQLYPQVWLHQELLWQTGEMKNKLMTSNHRNYRELTETCKFQTPFFSKH